jgi:prolipoprotein diacylglyceryltransferase
MALSDVLLGIGIPLAIFFGLFFAVIGVLGFVFWILMLIDCVKRKFKEDVEKIVWLLVIIFTGIIGALIYYFIVKKNNKKRRR